MASVCGRVLIRARPFSGPKTLTAVEIASASAASGVIMVSLARPCALRPVRGLTMWLKCRPLMVANRR